jgi:hypothetical protein
VNKDSRVETSTGDTSAAGSLMSRVIRDIRRRAACSKHAELLVSRLRIPGFVISGCFGAMFLQALFLGSVDLKGLHAALEVSI